MTTLINVLKVFVQAAVNAAPCFDYKNNRKTHSTAFSTGGRKRWEQNVLQLSL